MFQRWERVTEKKVAENPLGLSEQDRIYVDGLIVGGEENRQMARQLYDHHQAEGTIKAYSRTIAAFKRYCEETESLSYEEFGEKEVLNFIIEAVAKDKGPQFLATIKPAVERIEEMRGIPKEKTAFTAVVNKHLAGAKRTATQAAPKKIKKEAIPVELIEEILEKDIYAKGSNIENIDFETLRTVFKWVVQAQTFCRFDEFSRLRACDFRFNEDKEGIIVSFCRGAKNDQMHKGNERVLPRQRGKIFDAYTLTLIFFEKCGYKMDQKDQGINHCAMTKNGKPVQRRLSRQAASKGTAKLLRKYGYDPRKYGETSAKRTGVTNAYRQGVPLEKIQELGNWRTPGMPREYVQATDEYKAELAKSMNLGVGTSK